VNEPQYVRLLAGLERGLPGTTVIERPKSW
jgi:hypothetical protein